jgi:hypothetical protein
MSQSKLSIANMGLSHLGMKPVLNLTDDKPSQNAINTFWEPSRDDVFSEYRWPWATTVDALVPAFSAWDVGTSYITGNLVSFNTKYYQCINGNTGNQPDQDPTDWLLLPLPFPMWQFMYQYPTLAARVWTVFGQVNSTQVNPNDGSTMFVNSLLNEEQQEFEIAFSILLNNKIICSNNENALTRYTYIIEDFSIWDAKFIMAFSYRLAANMCVLLTGDGDKAMKMMSVYNAFMAETKRTAYAERIKKPNQVSGYQTSRG